MKVENLFIIFAYNRPEVFSLSFKSLICSIDYCHLQNYQIVIIDDKADQKIKDTYLSYLNKYNITVLNDGNNKNYANRFFEAFSIAEKINPKYVSFIETDYEFRDSFYEDCLKIMHGFPNLLGIKATSHEDYFDKKKCINWFSDVSIEQYGKDVPNRNNLYTNFSFDKFTLQYGTHAMCCFLLNWDLFIKILKSNEKYITQFSELFTKATLLNGTTPNDGMITGGLSLIYSDFFNLKEDDSMAAFINVVDPILSIHRTGGGINGKYLPEMSASNFYKDKNFSNIPV